MKKILIEGWRNINHSFAMVNQNQLLAMREISGLEIFHRDAPFFMSHWAQSKDLSGFAAADVSFITNIPDCEESSVDLVYKIFSPIPSVCKDIKTFVFIVTEFGLGEKSFIDPQIDFNDFKKNGNLVITPSAWSKERLIEFGIPEQGIRIVPHGVKTDIFRPMPADERLKNRQNLGIQEDEIVISNVGVPTWNKGLDILIEAVARLINSGRKIKLILKNNKELYGLGIEDTIQKFAKEYPSLVTDNFFSSVQLVQSTLNLDQLRALYCISDIYASPYRAEGFNLPVLEAMACGTYVLITDGGATDDFFHDACGRKIKSDPRSLTVKEKYEGKYREPDLNSLIECIDDCIENKISASGDVLTTRVNLIQQHSWFCATQTILDLS